VRRKEEEEGVESGMEREREKERREREAGRLGTLPEAPLCLFRRPRDAQRDHR